MVLKALALRTNSGSFKRVLVLKEMAFRTHSGPFKRVLVLKALSLRTSLRMVGIREKHNDLQ